MKRSCTCMQMVATALGVGAALTIGLGAFAGDPENESVEPLRFFEYQERPGAYEFSGRMIARPKSIEAWMRDGLNEMEARSRYDRAAGHLDATYQVIRYVPQLDHYVFNVPGGLTENDVARELLATGNYKFVEPNWRVYPADCPDDSRFNQQWHHDDDHLQSCDGWDIYTGDPSVAIGVCDTGIRFTHEDLQLHRLEGYNAVDRRWENDGGQISDIYGHGTETTGCAAGNGNNGIGIAGVGWDLSHRMLRVTNSSGGGSDIDTLNHAAITAVENGDRVASLSYHGVENQATLDAASYIKSIGGLMIWAAGNWGINMNMNNRDDDDVIVVGATDINDIKAGWSNYGRFVDFVAPGVDVYTTAHTGDNQYHAVSGTSFACPLTSGLAGLIWSVNPSLTPNEVEDIIKQSCEDLGTPGIDDTYGYGRINVHQAMLLAGGGDRMRLDLTDLVSGQENQIRATNCRPRKRVFFAYSITGPGNTYIPELDVTADILNPRLIDHTMASLSGEASIDVFVPNKYAGIHLWIQALQPLRESDVWEGDVQ